VIVPVDHNIVIAPVAHNIVIVPVDHNILIAPVAHNIVFAPVTHNIVIAPVAHNIVIAPVAHNIVIVPVDHNITPNRIKQPIRTKQKYILSRSFHAFHMFCISYANSLYFKIILPPIFITFLSPETVTSINMLFPVH
jgi:hypothetical protein